jgi:hypothetical protein
MREHTTFRGDRMTCAACGAAAAKNRDHCVVCGLAREKNSPQTWSRDVEAGAYEDLSQLLEAEESILGMTRGRLVGSWRPRAGLNPRALFTPFVNLGLSHSRLILQPIQQSDGRAVTSAAASYPLSSIIAMTRSDADVLEPGRTIRLIVHFAAGESMRLKTSGRMAESANSLVEVWQSLYRDQAGNEPPAGIPCRSCGRELDRPYKFCPFCGNEQEDAE